MDGKPLTETQYKKIGKELSKTIKNKTMPHQTDMWRVAVLFYELMERGYLLGEPDVDNIIKESGDNYDDLTKQELHHMAQAFSNFANGKDLMKRDRDQDRFKNLLESLEAD